MTLRVFPVSGGASYVSDFDRTGDRIGRVHLGNDLFASEGTPVLAVDSGAVYFTTDPKGGQVAYLRAPDGTRYYYAHLSGFEGAARDVTASEIIGYVGRTGNAATTAPHLHFEVHSPQGTVDPFPFLRQAAVETKGGRSSGLGLTLLALGVAGYLAYQELPGFRSAVRKALPV